MIRVDFSLSPSPSSNSCYSVIVKSCFVPEGETPYSEKALQKIASHLKDVAFDLPNDIGPDDVFHFYLSYHENAVLTSKISERMPEEMYLSQNDLAQKILEGEKELEQDDKKDNVGYRYPILHVSAANMLSGDKRLIHNIRYYNVMDSSIWNYYISFQELFSVEGLNHLYYIFKQIIRNQIGELYELRISTEYADLNARLIQSDYTDPIGHGSSVTPFLFHSEWKMKRMYEEILLNNPEIVKQRWRFLLLDDCVIDSLRLHSGEETKFDPEIGQIVKSSKLAIVKRAIEDIPDMSVSWYYYHKGTLIAKDSEEHNDNTRVQLWCVKTIDDALSLLKCNKFDIILLDYLLGSHSLTADSIRQFAIDNGLSETSIGKMIESWEEDSNSSSREYGYQLLKRLKFFLSSGLSFQGPVGRQYFMFISAFTTAVDERLRAEGLNRSEEFWQIGEGACPTNTPELFKFRLLQLMCGRLKQTCIQDLSYESIVDVIEGIFAPELKKMKLLRSLDGRLRQIKIKDLSSDINIIIEEVKTALTPTPKEMPLIQELAGRINKRTHDLSYDSIINEVERLFVPELIRRDKRIESVRKRAYKAYKTVLGNHYDYFTLKMDEGQSLLVDSFLSDKDHMDSLLEHLLQFVHLTAFGTVRQWPDIWEEYQCVVRSLGSSVSTERIQEVSSYIEQHIIDLKSN